MTNLLFITYEKYLYHTCLFIKIARLSRGERCTEDKYAIELRIKTCILVGKKDFAII